MAIALIQCVMRTQTGWITAVGRVAAAVVASMLVIDRSDDPYSVLRLQDQAMDVSPRTHSFVTRAKIAL